MNISGIIRLKRGKEISVQRRHPWIFSGAIQLVEGAPPEGSWVAVTDHRNQPLGFGHYQTGSITVRMLTFGAEAPTDVFWETKIKSALQLRATAGLPSADTNAFRLIHGEGDALPGLIVDVYDGVAVVQAHSIGMHQDRARIAEALSRCLPLTSIYYKSKSTLPGGLRTSEADSYLLGMSAVPHIIYEHGHKFFIDWEEGQKTGFFLDQRENRKLLSGFCPGKEVLNTFCYTGGFSVYALKAGAVRVHSIDASEKAVEATRKNIELNGFNFHEHTCYTEDTFRFLEKNESAYDVIILDPPAFAKHREARHQAIKGYQRLNATALRVIKPGGILFTFSCSQVVDKRLFYDTVVSAAIQCGRDVKVLHQLSQPADHPVSIYHPEGEYLKGLVLYIA